MRAAPRHAAPRGTTDPLGRLLGRERRPPPAHLARRPVPPRLEHRTLYARVLGLRVTDLHPWHVRLLLDGAFSLGVVLALAEVVTAWAPLAVPLLVAASVKAFDAAVVATASRSARPERSPREPLGAGARVRAGAPPGPPTGPA